jgi:hypothetical protein
MNRNRLSVDGAAHVPTTGPLGASVDTRGSALAPYRVTLVYSLYAESPLDALVAMLSVERPPDALIISHCVESARESRS